MLGAIETLATSEYNNVGDLMGLGGDVTQELMGYLGTLDPVSKTQLMKKLAKPTAASAGSRAEMEKYFNELPQNIKDQLLQGKLRLADHILYSIKPVNGSKTVKMFESQDVKETGLRNVSNARLPKNMAMLVTGIFLLQGVAASTGSDDVKSTNYDYIDAKGALATGEFTFRANKKQLLSETSLMHFRTKNLTTVPTGYYKLHNPRLIQDDVDLEFDIELGTVTGVDTKAYLFLGLHGTITIP